MRAPPQPWVRLQEIRGWSNSRNIGFSFSGEVREPFPAVIRALQETKLPVTSVDAPSSWDIENGPPNDGLGSTFHPDVLVSLTAPKPLVKHFAGRHFIGGRYEPSCVFRVSSPTSELGRTSHSTVGAPLQNHLKLIARVTDSFRRVLPRNMISTCQSMEGLTRLSKWAPTAKSCNWN